MSTDRDVTRIVRSWLHEDAHEDADRILNLVLDEVDTTPQRSASWLARRFPPMNTYLKVGLAASVVVLAGFIGLQLLSGPDVGSGGESPSAAPSASAVDSAAPSAPTEGGLPVGSSFLLLAANRFVSGAPAITVTIPAPGWSGDSGEGILVKNDNVDPPDGAGMIVFAGEDLYVYGDPCHWSTTTPDTPVTTVDGLVAALSAQALRDATAPVDVTVGGYAGMSITIHVPEDAAYAAGQFTDCDQGYFGSWGVATEQTPARYHQGPGQIDELWVLDVGGSLVVIDTGHYSQTPAADVAEKRAIAESATFELQ